MNIKDFLRLLVTRIFSYIKKELKLMYQFSHIIILRGDINIVE